MSNPTQTTLHFVVKPSVVHRYWLHGVHALALIACIANGLPVVAQSVLIVVVAGVWYRSHRQCRNAPYHLHHHSLQGWSLSRDGEVYHTIALLPTTMASAWLMSLHYRRVERSKAFESMMILRNDLHPDDFRRLYVRLRLFGS